MTASWQFALAPAVQALPALRDEWQSVLDELPSAMPFQTPAWIDAYARHGGNAPGDVVLVTARHQGRLVAVLPLVLGHQRLGPLSLGTASLVFSPHMPLADVIALPEQPGLWTALLDWLQRGSGVSCVRLELPGVVRDGTLGQWLAGAPMPRTLSTPTGEAARIDTQMDFAALLKAVSSKHRSNLSRSTKRAEALGPLRYEVFERDDALARGLPLLLEIEASGWKGRAGSAIGSDDKLTAFYRAAIDGLARTGQSAIGVLWFGDRPAAAGLHLKAGRSVVLHKLGYREEWAAMGPGHLYIREMVQRACADPALDSVGLVLRPPWSEVWRPVASPVDHHSLFAPSLMGRLVYRVAEARRKRAAAKATQAATAASPEPMVAAASDE